LIKAVKTVVSGINKQTTPQKLARFGDCRRYPLKTRIFGDDEYCFDVIPHPATSGNEWCGEWQERKE
jgi:hypothetical protein